MLLLAVALVLGAVAASDTDVVASTCTDLSCAPIKMPYRQLGRSGLYVSALSYGAWLSFANQISEDEAFNIMKVAYEQGINFFDNAETYAEGKAESVMGNALQSGFKEGVWQRSDLVISTKIFWGGQGPNDVGLSRKHIIEGLDKSLARLQLSYVDVVFCHRFDPHTPMEETVRAMNHVINQGKALYWGTSEWSSSEIEQAYAVADRLGLVGPLVEQPQYNLLHRDRVEVEYASLYSHRGLGTTIWSPLASGVLTGKYNHGIPEGSRLSEKSFAWLKEAFESGKRHGNWDSVIARVRQLENIAQNIGCTTAQLAIAWCIQNKHVSTVLFGATSAEQVLENVRALHYIDRITPQIMHKIDEIFDAPEPNYDWTNYKKKK